MNGEITMKTSKIVVLAIMMLCSHAALSFDLITEIKHEQGKYTVESKGNAKVDVLKGVVNQQGLVFVNGKISVQGKGSLVIWFVVDGNKYFSKLPSLQNVENISSQPFKIPFNAGDKTVSEMILEVEIMGGGKIVIDGIKLSNGS